MYHLEGRSVHEIAQSGERTEKRIYKDLEAGATKLVRFLESKGLDRRTLLASLESTR